MVSFHATFQLLNSTKRVSAGVLWANLNLLFWLSLFPFCSGWMGEHHAAPMPAALYGVVLLMAAVSYYLLQRTIIAQQGPDSLLAKALGTDWKGMLSPLGYIAGIPLAFVNPWISTGLYASVAMLWLIPDRRIERALDMRE